MSRNSWFQRNSQFGPVMADSRESPGHIPELFHRISMPLPLTGEPGRYRDRIDIDTIFSGHLKLQANGLLLFDANGRRSSFENRDSFIDSLVEATKSREGGALRNRAGEDFNFVPAKNGYVLLAKSSREMKQLLMRSTSPPEISDYKTLSTLELVLPLELANALIKAFEEQQQWEGEYVSALERRKLPAPGIARNPSVITF